MILQHNQIAWIKTPWNGTKPKVIQNSLSFGLLTWTSYLFLRLGMQSSTMLRHIFLVILIQVMSFISPLLIGKKINMVTSLIKRVLCSLKVLSQLFQQLFKPLRKKAMLFSSTHQFIRLLLVLSVWIIVSWLRIVLLRLMGISKLILNNWNVISSIMRLNFMFSVAHITQVGVSGLRKNWPRWQTSAKNMVPF